jgi:hypothetical protein
LEIVIVNKSLDAANAISAGNNSSLTASTIIATLSSRTPRLPRSRSGVADIAIRKHCSGHS